MNVALYIRELLGEQNEVWVPGLGNFFKRRIDGFFNEKENRLYPPVYILSFDIYGKEDNSLSKYISHKKNISLASAKYFIEKFVRAVQEQAQHGIADDIALLGNLYYHDSKLIFDPIQRDEINANFYGLKPINAHKIKGIIAGTERLVVPVYNDQLPLTPPDILEPVEEESQPRKMSAWLKVLFILIITALSLLIIYQYNPLFFDQLRSQKFIQHILKPEIDSAKSVVKIQVDSSHLMPLNQPVTDTQATAVNIPVEEKGPLPFEILGGAFGKESEAEKALLVYESKGLQARILPNSPGRLFKITLGSFENEEDAIRKRDSIIKFTNILLKDIYIQRYKKKD